MPRTLQLFNTVRLNTILNTILFYKAFMCSVVATALNFGAGSSTQTQELSIALVCMCMYASFCSTADRRASMKLIVYLSQILPAFFISSSVTRFQAFRGVCFS